MDPYIFSGSGSGSGSSILGWTPIRIRIQHLRMDTNTDPDPDPIWIQGFNDQKLKKNYGWNLFFIFLWSKTAIYLSLGLHKVCPCYKEAFSSEKRPSNTSKHELLQIFVYFCGSFLPSWIRIRIHRPDWIRIQSGSGSRIRIHNPAFLHSTAQ